MRGPLHALHERLGARFTEFSGFEMPVMYAGIKAEHEAVRSAAGLFDVSHMSNLRLVGPGATDLVSRCTVADASVLEVGQGVYSCILRPDGTIIDDTIVYRVADDTYDMVPNAGMNHTVAQHLQAHAKGLDVQVNDVSHDMCIFALQGPKAQTILGKLTQEVPLEPRFRMHVRELVGQQVQVATTGYTGEGGYELFVSVQGGEAVFESLLEAGADEGLVPVGLGARDTLRLEMGFALAGHEFAGGRTPLEAGLGWTIKWDHDFVGRDALVAKKETGDHERLVGLKVTGRGGVPREGMPIVTPEDQKVGTVSSGTMSPSLGHGIALGYVAAGHHKKGTELAIEVRGKPVPAEVQRPPFLKK